MAELREDMRKGLADAAGIKATLERMEKAREMRNTTSIRIEGAGPVWASVTCCVVMLAVSIVAALWVSREFGRIDKELNERKEEGQRMQSYLSAIYVRAPQLQPTDSTQESDNGSD